MILQAPKLIAVGAFLLGACIAILLLLALTATGFLPPEMFAWIPHFVLWVEIVKIILLAVLAGAILADVSFLGLAFIGIFFGLSAPFTFITAIPVDVTTQALGIELSSYARLAAMVVLFTVLQIALVAAGLSLRR